MGHTSEQAAPTRRDWMSVGAQFSEPYREEIEREIAGLTWTSEPSAPMSPGLGINACIEELRIPKVSGYATGGYLRIPDGPESAHCSIYGIEGNYSNGRVRVYVLDTGSTIYPLAADLWG